MAVGTIFFLYAKAITLITRSDVDVFMAVREDALDYNFKFNAKDDGFFVAAALTEYNSNTTVTEEARYGELIIRHYGWGYSDDAIGAEGKAIEYHFCTDEELGLVEGPDTIVFPRQETMISEVISYKNKFKCINNEDLVIWGDYNSAKT